jgi:hypothetical protein
MNYTDWLRNNARERTKPANPVSGRVSKQNDYTAGYRFSPMTSGAQTGESSGAGKPRQSHHHEVFSASRAGHLDTRLRRFIYRPDHLAERYVQPGNTVLDFGCGSGFFTREFAKRVGTTGRVIAADVQQEMLGILQEKLGPEGLLPRITTHSCEPDSLNFPLNIMAPSTLPLPYSLSTKCRIPISCSGRSLPCSNEAGRSTIPIPCLLFRAGNTRTTLRSLKRQGSGWLTGRSFS